MPQVALLTEHKYTIAPIIHEPTPYQANVIKENLLLQEQLQALDIQTDVVGWDTPNIDWQTYDMVVFRTTWNYFHLFDQFTQWLDHIEPLTTSANPFTLMRWNLNKHYLIDLQQQGIHIVPTWFIPRHSDTTIRDIATANNLTKLVLKPAVSGGARHTYLISKEEIDQHEPILSELLQNEDMIIQPYMEQITSRGEVSHMVIAGQYSHSILKKSKGDDYRVQDDFGGTVHPYQASPEEVDFALAVCRASPAQPMYARVDVLWDNENQLALGEIELIEPELWFRECPQAAKVLAQGIAKKLI